MGARSAGLGEGKMAQPLQTGEEGRVEKVGYFLSFRSAAMKLYAQDTTHLRNSGVYVHVFTLQ